MAISNKVANPATGNGGATGLLVGKFTIVWKRYGAMTLRPREYHLVLLVVWPVVQHRVSVFQQSNLHNVKV